MAEFRDMERPSGYNRLYYDAMFICFYISAFVFTCIDFNLAPILYEKLNQVSPTRKGDLLIATLRFILLSTMSGLY